MNPSPLSDQMALRIGLAARMLPDTDAARLLRVLEDAVGLPPSDERMSGLKLKVFKAAAEGELADIDSDSLKAALAVLKGEAEPELDDLPQVEQLAQGDMPGSIRVACASNSSEQLDGHFGSCRRFLIYQVSAQEVRLIDVRRLASLDDDGEKNDQRAELIADCAIVFVNSIGGPAAAKVVKRDIHPIKSPEVVSARAKVEELRQILGTSPPPWLARIMGQQPRSLARFAAAEEAE